MAPPTSAHPQKSTRGLRSLTKLFVPYQPMLEKGKKEAPKGPAFHLFPKLLLHIRRKIWLFAHQNSGRIIEVTTWPGTYGSGVFDTDSPYHTHMNNVPQNLPLISRYGGWNGWEARANQAPVLLHVCWEARNLLRPLYATPFRRNRVRGSATKTTETTNLLFCWEKDTVLINLKVFRQRGNNLEMVFRQLFGNGYVDAKRPNSIKKNLRHLAGNHEFWMSLFRHPTILPEFTAFFEQFANLQLKYVPLYLQKRSGNKLLGFEEEFLVNGRWSTQFRREFFKMPLNWFRSGRKDLDKLCKQNAGGKKYIKERRKIRDENVYAPITLRTKGFLRALDLRVPPKKNSDQVFTVFPNLPLELRNIIWEFALPDRRFITVYVPPVWNDYAESDKRVHPADITYWHPVAIGRAPAQFFACQEAREMVNKHYIPLHGNDGFGAVYYCPEIDVICFDGEPCGKLPDHIINRGFLKSVPEKILNQVTCIHICLFPWRSGPTYRWTELNELMDRLPNLRKVFSKTNYSWDFRSGRPMIGWRENKNDKWFSHEVAAYLQNLDMNVPRLAKIVKHGKPQHDLNFNIYLDHM